MKINTPQHHDFPQSLRDKISSVTDYFVPEWEISVPRENDLAWSIVLSYLMSTDFRNPRDFGKRLEALTGNKENEELIKKSIRNFNPFRDRYFCYNDNLKSVVSNFKNHLQWQNLPSVADKLNAVSKAIKCPILLVLQDYKISDHYEIFNKANGNVKNFITLIALNDLNSSRHSITDCNFMIDGIYGLQMRSAALKYYLNKTDIPKKIIKKLIPAIDKENNFMKAVLNSEYKKYIFEVYEYRYVVSKLSEAGYDMHPRKRDSEGFSGFYYALKDNISNYSYYFYVFMVNNFDLFPESLKNSALTFVSNLQSMGVFLSDVSEKIAKDRGMDLENRFRALSVERKEISIEHSPQNYDEMKKKCDELLQFNNFLLEWHSECRKIKNKSNNDDSITKTIFEAGKRRDIITSLLDAYENVSSSLFEFDEYILHKNFYEAIDHTTTRYFFNSITPLKEKLKLDNKTFSKIESSLFFYNLFKYGLKEIFGLKAIETLNPKCRLTTLRILHRVFYDFREEIRKKLYDFNMILKNTTIDEGNAIDHIPETEIYSVLDSYPFIKNFIDVARLWDHTKICENIKNMDAKSILTMERTLQVIGENLTPKENILSYKRLLSLCLPKEMSRVLRCLRNVLTHSDINNFQSRFECEKDMSLFTSIKNEIIEIKKCFRPVYRIMVLNIDIHISNIVTDEVEKAIHSQRYSNIDISCLKNICYHTTHTSEFFQRDKLLFYNFLRIVLQTLENEVENEYISGEGSVQDKKKKIIYLLWPLQWLLEFFQKCKMDGAVEPLYLLEKLKETPIDSLNVLKEKTDIFIKECYNFLPRFNVNQTRSTTSALTSFEHIERFQKLLNGSVYFSNKETDKIIKAMPKTKKQKASMKNESEKLFARNCVERKKYDKFCDELQLLGKAGELKKLARGSTIKVSMNKLEILLSRILLLKEIAIHENEEIRELWTEKEENTQELIRKKIAFRCLNDVQFLVVIEMLLLDCMNLSQIVKKKDAWYKSTVLFEGTSFRNLISHGDPKVEVLGKIYQSHDDKFEIADKILLLIKGEDAIVAILELYKLINNDFSKLLDAINCGEKDDYYQLRNRIKNCSEWNNYVLLLPAKRKRECTKGNNEKRDRNVINEI